MSKGGFGGSLARSAQPKKEPKLRIVVVCEGKVTEVHYFKLFKKLYANGLVEVEPIGGCGVPVSVVERAVEEYGKLRAIARRSSDSFDRHFEVWAVFDRDAHPVAQVPAAMKLAAENSIHVAYSNPCFEVWGLMHFGCYQRPGHHHETQKALKDSYPGYCHEKNPVIDPVFLKDRYEQAVVHSRKALQARESEDRPRGDPSTNVHELTERIRRNGRAGG